MEFLAALTILVGGASVYLASKVFPDLAPGNRKIDRDLKEMREEIQGWNLDWAPLGKEELELFSLNQEKYSMKKGFTTKVKGIFTTIFHEAAAAYSYKSYISSKSNAVLYARTAKHHFVYRITGKGVLVSIDDFPIGTVGKDGALYGARRGKAIAHIQRDRTDATPIIVGDREAGSLVKDKPDKSKGLSPRAFEFVRSDLTPQEEAVFISLVILELVERVVER